MKVYLLIEFRRSGERINWGVFSSYEYAIGYLKFMNWENDPDFKIIDYEVDEKLRRW